MELTEKHLWETQLLTDASYSPSLAIYIAFAKLGVAAHDYNPRVGELDARESEVHGHPQLLAKFKVSLNFMRPSLETTKQNNCPY